MMSFYPSAIKMMLSCTLEGKKGIYILHIIYKFNMLYMGAYTVTNTIVFLFVLFNLVVYPI